MAADWNAIGAGAGVVSVAVVFGGAVVRVVRKWFADSRNETDRISNLEIRLWGLPADPKSGAKKLDGEFDVLYRKVDALPELVAEAVRSNK